MFFILIYLFLHVQWCWLQLRCVIYTSYRIYFCFYLLEFSIRFFSRFSNKFFIVKNWNVSLCTLLAHSSFWQTEKKLTQIRKNPYIFQLHHSEFVLHLMIVSFKLDICFLSFICFFFYNRFVSFLSCILLFWFFVRIFCI